MTDRQDILLDQRQRYGPQYTTGSLPRTHKTRTEWKKRKRRVGNREVVTPHFRVVESKGSQRNTKETGDSSRSYFLFSLDNAKKLSVGNGADGTEDLVRESSFSFSPPRPRFCICSFGVWKKNAWELVLCSSLFYSCFLLSVLRACKFVHRL